MSLRVQLDRESLVYRPGETVTGSVEISNLNNVQHAGLHVALNGTLHLVPEKGAEQVSKLIHKSKQLLSPGKILGNTAIDFSLQLISENNAELCETYHGKTVAIEYVVTADLTRTGFAKSLRTSVDFILQNPRSTEQGEGDMEVGGTPESFVIEDIGGMKNSRIKGYLKSTVIDLQKPILGELEIESAPVIDSIELQVVRQEKITTPEINTETASDAQVCEIVSGNIDRLVKVPIYCLLQKFIVAPSISNDKFKLAFMLRIMIKYKDDLSKSVREHYKDISIKLLRS